MVSLVVLRLVERVRKEGTEEMGSTGGGGMLGWFVIQDAG
jgi:hypothetical protein